MSAIATPFPLPFEGDVVQRTLRRLPPRQRAALLLRFGDGLSERQVAAVLGCRVVTVHTLLTRGVRRVLGQLERQAVVHPSHAHAAGAIAPRSLSR